MATILVVDDIQDNVKLLSQELTDLNHEVIVAYSGQQALDVVDKHRIDCVLLDIMMPEMDGFEVCRRLKFNTRLRSIPVIMISAKDADQDVVEGLNVGADDYISKPFNIQIVEARIQTALRGKRAHDTILEMNEKLDEARRVAQSANHSKDEFLANMSHEIRTPMTAILGFADVLSESVTKEEDVSAVTTIKRNGEYLLELINDILDISKIEAGKLCVEQIQCEPLQIVADVISLMRVRAMPKGLCLERSCVGNIPKVIISDPYRLRQILINLVGNAIKFTESGSIKLTVQLIEEENQPKIQFEVADTGVGMSRLQLSRLFRPFTQADSSTTRKFGGTGLGLTISKRLTEMLGGEIKVDSTLGQGSQFAVTVATGSLSGVELLEQPAEAFSANDRAKPSKTVEAIDLNCRVLLAEDGLDNQRLIAFLLKKANAEVTIADNGKVALDLALAEKAKGSPFEVILMDMQMPQMDGYEATRQLRGHGYTGPIIALTAHAMSGDREKCVQAGCDEYLSKPVDRKKLLGMVYHHARRSVEKAIVADAEQKPFIHDDSEREINTH